MGEGSSPARRVPGCLLSPTAGEGTGGRERGWALQWCRGFPAGFWDFSCLQDIVCCWQSQAWCPAWFLFSPCLLCSGLCPSSSDDSNKTPPALQGPRWCWIPAPIPDFSSSSPFVPKSLREQPVLTQCSALGHPRPRGAHRPHPQAAPDAPSQGLGSLIPALHHPQKPRTPTSSSLPQHCLHPFPGSRNSQKFWNSGLEFRGGTSNRAPRAGSEPHRGPLRVPPPTSGAARGSGWVWGTHA